MKKEKLSPKEAVIKGLETRLKNLTKKLALLSDNYRIDKSEILQDMQVVNIQLIALKKK